MTPADISRALRERITAHMQSKIKGLRDRPAPDSGGERARPTGWDVCGGER